MKSTAAGSLTCRFWLRHWAMTESPNSVLTVGGWMRISQSAAPSQLCAASLLLVVVEKTEFTADSALAVMAKDEAQLLRAAEKRYCCTDEVAIGWR